MDESLVNSLARLAKSRINIVNIDGNRVQYEFVWRPVPGRELWVKAVVFVPAAIEADQVRINQFLLDLVRAERAYLEPGDGKR